MKHITSSDDTKLSQIRIYAKLLDSQFTIPFLNIKFGMDPILSLMPILGPFSGLLTGFGLLGMAHKRGISGEVRARMAKNIFIDYFWSMIPVLGNIKDIFLRSNEKNLKILEDHWTQGLHQGTGAKICLQTIGILFVFGSLSMVAFLFLLRWIVSLFLPMN
ncbi:MAG: DUF4112 domain-containing protein [Chitinophagales bacterium]